MSSKPNEIIDLTDKSDTEHNEIPEFEHLPEEERGNAQIAYMKESAKKSLRARIKEEEAQENIMLEKRVITLNEITESKENTQKAHEVTEAHKSVNYYFKNPMSDYVHQATPQPNVLSTDSKREEKLVDQIHETQTLNFQHAHVIDIQQELSPPKFHPENVHLPLPLKSSLKKASLRKISPSESASKPLAKEVNLTFNGSELKIIVEKTPEGQKITLKEDAEKEMRFRRYSAPSKTEINVEDEVVSEKKESIMQDITNSTNSIDNVDALISPKKLRSVKKNNTRSSKRNKENIGIFI